MTREYVYRGFNRFWHWMQAFLILFLTLTGFEVHGSISFFGFEQAVAYHSVAATALLVLIAFAAFWHLTTGEWRQYLPTRANLREQAAYYLSGIFRNAPEPTRKSARNKLNPLQRLVYLGLKLLVIPVMGMTGLLYLYYRYPQSRGIGVLSIEGLEVIALLHTAGAFLLVAFVLAHLYLITTGATPLVNLKAMITGWHEEHDENGRADTSDDHRLAGGSPVNTRYMNPYAAGVLLGLVLLAAVFVSGRGLGASGAFKSGVVACVESLAPAHAREAAFFTEYREQNSGNPLKQWLVFEVVGVVIGGFLSGLVSGRLRWVTEKGPRIGGATRMAFALAGGVLFGFGAQMARGCTSGAALSGMAVLSTAGFITMMAIFGTGFALAWFFRRLWT